MPSRFKAGRMRRDTFGTNARAVSGESVIVSCYGEAAKKKSRSDQNRSGAVVAYTPPVMHGYSPAAGEMPATLGTILPCA